MNWYEYLQLGTPFTTGEAFFIMWFIGFVGGYCVGRAHAAWITLNNFMKAHTK